MPFYPPRWNARSNLEEETQLAPIVVPENRSLEKAAAVVGYYGVIHVDPDTDGLTVVPTDPVAAKWIYSTFAVLKHAQ